MLPVRRFYLERYIDESGISGTGKVATGCQFPSGKCYLEWLVSPQSATMHDSTDAMMRVHGHNGATELVWIDPAQEIITKGDYENKHMPDRNRTYTAIWQAVRSGKIKRGKCRVCGASKTQAHHYGSYTGTKGIVWLCDEHHRAAHVRLRKAKKNISKGEVLKSDNSKHIAYMIAAKPNELDTDSQWWLPEEIEVVAWRFLINYRLQKADIFEEHIQKRPDIFLVESYVTPVDFTIIDSKGQERSVAQGTWIVGFWIPSDETWNRVLQGQLVGASPRGPGQVITGEMPANLTAN